MPSPRRVVSPPNQSPISRLPNWRLRLALLLFALLFDFSIALEEEEEEVLLFEFCMPLLFEFCISSAPSQAGSDVASFLLELENSMPLIEALCVLMSSSTCPYVYM